MRVFIKLLGGIVVPLAIAYGVWSYWELSEDSVPFESGQPFYAGWCEQALSDGGHQGTSCETFLYDNRLAIRLRHDGAGFDDPDLRRRWIEAMVALVVEESARQDWLRKTTRLLVLEGPSLRYTIPRSGLKRLRERLDSLGPPLPWPYVSRELETSTAEHFQ